MVSKSFLSKYKLVTVFLISIACCFFFSMPFVQAQTNETFLSMPAEIPDFRNPGNDDVFKRTTGPSDDGGVVGLLLALGSFFANPELIPLKIPAFLFAFGALIIQFISFIVFVIVASILQQFFTPDFYLKTLGGFASNAFVNETWQIFMNFCNFFFILTLLFIGIGTIYQVEKYNYRKLLLRLILVALFSNFSLAFAGVILDLFHVIMFSFPDNVPALLYQSLSEVFNFSVFTKTWKELIRANAIEDLIYLITFLMVSTLVIFMIVITLIGITFLLLIRVIALWFLLIVSPFAYVGLILPDTEQIAKKWWTAFLNYAMLGPILFFFVWFSTQMIRTVFHPGPIMTAEGIKSAEEPLTTTLATPQTIFNLLASVVMLGGSLYAASTLGVYGASTVQSWASKAVLASTALGGAGAYRVGAKVAGKGMRIAGTTLQTKFPESKLGGLGTVLERGSKVTTASAAFSPDSIVRAGIEQIKRYTSSASAEEDAEARQNIKDYLNQKFGYESKDEDGNLQFRMGTRSYKDKKAAGDNEVAQRAAKRRELEELIDSKNAELRDLEGNNSQSAQAKRVVLKEDINFAEEEQKKVDKSGDEAARKAREASVIDQNVNQAFQRPKEDQQKVQQYTSTLKDKSTDELSNRWFAAHDDFEREAIIRTAATQGTKNLNDFVGSINKGADGPGELQNILKKTMKNDGQIIDILSDIKKIGEKDKDSVYSNVTTKDATTKKVRAATKQEQIDLARAEKRKGMSFSDVSKLKPHEVSEENLAKTIANVIKSNPTSHPTMNRIGDIDIKVQEKLSDKKLGNDAVDFNALAVAREQAIAKAKREQRQQTQGQGAGPQGQGQTAQGAQQNPRGTAGAQARGARRRAARGNRR